jgi:hypothetical protein
MISQKRYYNCYLIWQEKCGNPAEERLLVLTRHTSLHALAVGSTFSV